MLHRLTRLYAILDALFALLLFAESFQSLSLEEAAVEKLLAERADVRQTALVALLYSCAAASALFARLADFEKMIHLMLELPVCLCLFLLLLLLFLAAPLSLTA